MARRRKRPAPHVNHERWLVSYADFITLLFAFFTTMYAISTVDAQKMSKMVASMQVALKSDPQPLLAVPVPLPQNGVPQPIVPRLDNLVVLRQQLASRLQRQIEQGNVEIGVDARGLVVSIREAGSFPSGSAELSDGVRALLAQVAAPLSELPHPVRIEGHTDDTPIRNSAVPVELGAVDGPGDAGDRIPAERSRPVGVAAVGGRLRRIPSARAEHLAGGAVARTAASTSSSSTPRPAPPKNRASAAVPR